MEAKFFKVSALTAAMVGAVVAMPVMANEDGMGPEYSSAASKFYEDHKLSGGIFYFQRDRQRKNAEGTYETNLAHGTAQVSLNYNSGYAWNVIGLDVGGFGAADLSIDDSNPVNQENEFSFAGKRWGENYSNGKSKGGGSLTNAALKLQLLDGAIKAKGGLTQLYVPGIIGVNWSYQPGSYLGGQIEGNFDNLYVTGAYATEYKAPWYTSTSKFSKKNAWDSDKYSDGNKIDYIWGMAARYTFANNMSLTAGFGQSDDYMNSYHAKFAGSADVLDGLNYSYQFYGSDTAGDAPAANSYDGLAWQQALTASLAKDLYTFRAEFLMTYAKNNSEHQMGNYLPRLTRGYANSQGANEIWWDSRSDWNHHNEKALFAGVWRNLDDLLGAPGFNVGVSGAYGWDAEYYTIDKKGKESAVNVDVTYTVQDGKAKGTMFKLHYTDYNNHQDELGSWAFPNMFTSEQDVKFHIIVPVSII